MSFGPLASVAFPKLLNRLYESQAPFIRISLLTRASVPLFQSQENDDDIGALGSILSWDEEEDNARTSFPASLIAKDRESNGSAPPDMVQFNNGEFNFVQFGGLTASQLKAHTIASSTGAAVECRDSIGTLQQRITLQLPLPTPVSALGQAGSISNDPQESSQPQAPPQAPNQLTQPAPPAPLPNPQPGFVLPQGPLMNQIAQILAQQASTMMQQQQQQQAGSTAQQMQSLQALPRTGSQPQVTQQSMVPPPSPQAQQNAQLTQQQQAMLQRLAAMQQQAVTRQQQAVTQQQHQTVAQQQHAATQQQQQQQIAAEQQRQLSQLQATVAQVQAQASAAQQQQRQQIPPQHLQFSSDPDALLQQLQYAQLQQQFQAAQAHANSQAIAASQTMKPPRVPTGPKASAPVAVCAAVQEQLKVHFDRAQKQRGVILPTPVLPQSSDAAKMGPGDGSLKRKAKLKAPPSVDSSSSNAPKATTIVSMVDVTSSSGLITASDTDGETSRNAKNTAKKSKQSEAASRMDSPSFDDDDDDDDDEPVSAEAKAKSNRDRNREHARNTRLRKKAYLEKLKATVDELCRERDTLVSERAGAANLLVEMHNTRTEVLMSLFALRSTNEKRRNLWSSILDESSFACVMPVTPYRSFPASEVQVSKCQRTIMGIDGMIADTSSLHVLFDSLVDRSRRPMGKIEFRYTLITEEAVVAGNQMMARWSMSTVNAVQCGVKMEVSKQGMLCCRFNSGHKITGLELMFDVMAFMLQLKQAVGTDTFSVIPNTVQTCQRAFDKPVVMTLADPPYTIIQVNKEWEKMTGYTAEEVVGKANCGILQGSITDRKAMDYMMHEIRFKRPFSVTLTNAKKSGEVFRNYLLLYPLSTDSRITHYLSISNFLDYPSPSSSHPPRLVESTAFLMTESKKSTPSISRDADAAPPAPASTTIDSQTQIAAGSGTGCDALAAMPPPQQPMGGPGSKRPHDSI
jgi:PAS domain S-box-containing protein